MFGNRSQRETKKASDSQSENFVRTVTLQIEGWVEVDIKEVFDVKTGSFKREEMEQILVRKLLEMTNPNSEYDILLFQKVGESWKKALFFYSSFLLGNINCISF